MDLRLSKEQINALPLRSFDGKIIVVSSLSDAKDALKMLKGEKTLGFDSETRPSFKKGHTNSVALIQLSSKSTSILFRLCKMGMPLELKQLLENENIIKVAQEPAYEIRRIYEDYGTRIKGVVDLAELSAIMDCSPKSLRGLTAIFLGFRISKKAQTSNWERTILTDKQINYAATDAWVSREVFMKMKQKSLIDTKSFDFKKLRKKIEYRKSGKWFNVEPKKYKVNGNKVNDLTKTTLIDSTFPALSYELYYFEVQKGGFSSFEEHFHTHTIIINKGHGKIFIGKDEFLAKPNDVFFIPPWEQHQFCQTGSDLFCFYCIIPKKRDRPRLLFHEEN